MFCSLSCDTKPRPFCGIIQSASGTTAIQRWLTGADPTSWRIRGHFRSDTNAPYVECLPSRLLKILKQVCKPSLCSHNAKVEDIGHELRVKAVGGSCAWNRNCVTNNLFIKVLYLQFDWAISARLLKNILLFIQMFYVFDLDYLSE